jgi:hypothetical protein
VLERYVSAGMGIVDGSMGMARRCVIRGLSRVDGGVWPVLGCMWATALDSLKGASTSRVSGIRAGFFFLGVWYLQRCHLISL